MPIDIVETGLDEDQVDSIQGKGRVKVKEAKIEEGQYGPQIRLTLTHEKGGLEFPAWISPSRPKLAALAACFGLPIATGSQKFDESDLVDKKGIVRVGSKRDSKDTLRAKVEDWIAAPVVAAKPAPVATKPLDEEGIPF